MATDSGNRTTVTDSAVPTQLTPKPAEGMRRTHPVGTHLSSHPITSRLPASPHRPRDKMNGALRTMPSSSASSLGGNREAKQTSQHEGPFNKGVGIRARRFPREGAINFLGRNWRV